MKRFASHFVSAALVVVAVIHLLPLSGALGAPQLNSLYGLTFGDPNEILLMRHRAVLFGILGTFLLVAAFRPAFRPAAFLGGFVSVGSFLWLARSTGGYNASVARVVAVDWVALAVLVVGVCAYAYEHDRRLP